MRSFSDDDVQGEWIERLPQFYSNGLFAIAVLRKLRPCVAFIQSTSLPFSVDDIQQLGISSKVKAKIALRILQPLLGFRRYGDLYISTSQDASEVSDELWRAWKSPLHVDLAKVEQKFVRYFFALRNFMINSAPCEAHLQENLLSKTMSEWAITEKGKAALSIKNQFDENRAKMCWKNLGKFFFKDKTLNWPEEAHSQNLDKIFGDFDSQFDVMFVVSFPGGDTGVAERLRKTFSSESVYEVCYEGNPGNPNCIIVKSLDSSSVLFEMKKRIQADDHVMILLNLLNSSIPVKRFDISLDDDILEDFENDSVYILDGKEVSNSIVFGNVLTLLRSWGQALASLKGELFMLQQHIVDSSRSRDFFSNGYASTFCACSSERILLPSVPFFFLCTEAGLLPSIISHESVTQQVSLVRLQSRPFKIRHPKIADLNSLTLLEHQWSSASLAATQDEIAERLSKNRNGQFVLEVNKKILAVVYTQKLTSIHTLFQESLTYEKMKHLHTENGAILQLISALSDPVASILEPADSLIKFVLEIAALKKVKKVVAVTRWSDYGRWRAKHHGGSHLEYFNLDCDTTVNWHKARGAKVVSLLLNFRATDKENDGHAVLIEYDLTSSSLRRRKKQNISEGHGHHHNIDSATSFLVNSASEILGIPADKIRADDGFFGIGFDSLQLFELRDAVAREFCISPPAATLFFQLGTSSRLASFLVGANKGDDKLQRIFKKVSSKHGAPLRSGKSASTLTRKISKHFGIEFQLSSLTEFSTYDDIARQVSQKLSEKAVVGRTTLVDTSSQSVKVLGYCAFFSDKLEDKLLNGEDFVGEPTRIELPANFPGVYFCRESVWGFDYVFWNMSKRESRLMDPHQRLLLKVSYWTFERSFSIFCQTETGVYVGLWESQFSEILQGLPGNPHYATGVSRAVAAGRISYLLGLNGPSMVIDTACSSSMAAVHVASMDLRSRVCNFSLVCSANIFLNSQMHYHLKGAGMLSGDFRCKTFDASANGYVRSEAAAAILLSNSQAVDLPGLPIIDACLMNQDGRSSGLTVPSGSAQQSLFKRTLLASRKKCNDVKFVEAHGTGTSLGDPIEVQSVISTFSGSRSLVLSAIKSCIGHTESCSGLLGIVSALESNLQDSSPIQLHFSNLNPHIGRLSCEVGQICIPLEKVSKRFGSYAINSFGFSGTNTQAILSFSEKIVPCENSSATLFPFKSDRHLKGILEQRISSIILTGNCGDGFIGPFPSCDFFVTVCRTKVLCCETISRNIEKKNFAIVLPGHGWKLLGSKSLLNESRRHFEELLTPFVSKNVVTACGSLALSAFFLFFIQTWSLGPKNTYSWGIGSFALRVFEKNAKLSQVVYEYTSAPHGSFSTFSIQENVVVEVGRSSFGRNRSHRWFYAYDRGSKLFFMQSMKIFETSIVSCNQNRLLFPFDNELCDPVLQIEEKAVSGDSIQEIVRHVISNVLHLDEFDDLRSFHDLGFDSNLAIEASQRLSKYFPKMKVDPSIFYDNPTAAHLINHLKSSSLPQAPFLGSDPKKTMQQQCYLDAISCRIGSSKSLNDFFLNLSKKRDLVQEITRWDWSSIYSEEHKPGKSVSKWGCLASKEICEFDASFFEISQREAESMDQQQKWLLETGWEAFDQGGRSEYFRQQQEVSVYAGLCHEGSVNSLDRFSITGSSCAVSVGRVSYTFGFTGPSLAIDTACSSSLVAFDLGCQSVCSGSCSLSLIFGAQSYPSVSSFITLSQNMMLSRSGRCRTFDQRADGYVRAEGCVSVLISSIHATSSFARVLGSMVNQDGQSNGLTAPNGSSQEKLLRALHGRINRTAVLLEAHGTGTSLGDPIEINAALSSVSHDPCLPFVLKSIKANIGHGECAAGLIGILSCIIYANVVVPQENFALLNSFIGVSNFQNAKVVIPLEKMQLSSDPIQCASSFGFSGTNAHAILEVFNGKIPATSFTDKMALFAKSNNVLDVQAEFLSSCLKGSGIVRISSLHLPKFLKASRIIRGGCIKELVQATSKDSIAVPVYYFSVPFFQRNKGVAPKPQVVGTSFSSIVEAAVQKVSGLAAYEDGQTFFELGFDSNMSIELATILTEMSGRKFNASLIYEHVSPKALIRHLDGSKIFKERKVESSETAHSIFLNAYYASAGNETGTEGFWRIFHCEKDIVTEVPKSRFDWRDIYCEKQEPTKSVSKWGAFLDDMNFFDPKHFGISRVEAISMDPQHRQLLKCSWNLIETFGDDLQEMTSVVVGMMAGDYWEVLVDAKEVSPFVTTGITASCASGRVSYMYNLFGPSFSVDTACSSSMVAFELSCQLIEHGESPASMCLGVNALNSKFLYVAISRSGMLSPSGRCRSFDKSADGYVRGEGCFGVILSPKREKALFSVIGHSMNQDGKSNGLTAPNGSAQTALLNKTFERVRFSSLVREAHATGTSLGDPIEINSISKSSKNQILQILTCGKGNIGHMESAAGLAGMAKQLLSASKNIVAKQLHLASLNPFVGSATLETMKAVIALESIKIEMKECHFSVSSFGMSGTNACAVLEKLKQESVVSQSSFLAVFEYHQIFMHVQTISKSLIGLGSVARSFGIRKRLQNNRTCFSYGRTVKDLLINLDHPSNFSLNFKTFFAFSEFSAPENLREVLTRDWLGQNFLIDYSTKRLVDRRRLTSIEGAVCATKVLLSTLGIWGLVFSNIYVESDIFLEPFQQEDIVVLKQKYSPNVTSPCLTNGRKELRYSSPCIGCSRGLRQEAVGVHLSSMFEERHFLSYPFLKDHFFFERKEPNRRKGLIIQKVPNPLGLTILSTTLSHDTIPELPDTHDILHVGISLFMLLSAEPGLVQKSISAHFLDALIIPPGKEIDVIVTGSAKKYELSCFIEDLWKVVVVYTVSEQSLFKVQEILPQEKSSKHISGEEFYSYFIRKNLPLGPSVRLVTEVLFSDDLVDARLLCNESQMDIFGIPVSVFDACAQLFILCAKDSEVVLVKGLENIQFYKRPQGSLPDLSARIFMIERGCGEVLIFCCGSLCCSFRCTVAFVRKMSGDQQSLLESRLNQDELSRRISSLVAEASMSTITDVENCENFEELGLDSLMGLGIRLSLENLGIFVTIDELRHNNPASLSRLIFQRQGKSRQKFFDLGGLTQNTHSSIIFCFPYGGGDGSTYSQWIENFSDSFIAPLQLQRDGSYKDIASLVHDISAEIAESCVEHQLLFYGHSFGALLAFEVCNNLADQGFSVALVVGAFGAPHVPNFILESLKSFWKVTSVQKALHFSVEEKFDGLHQHVFFGMNDKCLDLIKKKALCDSALHDILLIESYNFRFSNFHQYPIHVFGSDEDPGVPIHDLQKWTELGANVSILKGENHLFVESPKAAETLKKKLKQFLTKPKPKQINEIN